LRPAGRAVQEHRLPARARHDDRTAGLHDLAGDALAHLVLHRQPRLLEAVGRLDAKLAAVADQRDNAADDAVVAGENVEHVVERRFQVEGARQRLAHLEERREAADLGRLGGAFGGRFAGSERTGHRDPNEYGDNLFTSDISVYYRAPTCL